MNRIDLIPATIIACCVLHNICLNHPDELINMYEEEGRNFVVANIVEDIQVNLQNNLHAKERFYEIC
ncbi:hypothetical protein ALC57_11967 [Trachymyrmex cornetzi]|uniref:DDE Tnp4 domain-containing protein n=1 Tax=Trachymyrmex cornetzi TaxID=471704 RepID=A0A151K3N4_9HYME|nr:hypothetical protein ALC57_11967 [Trachymyrmex cornetzi]